MFDKEQKGQIEKKMSELAETLSKETGVEKDKTLLILQKLGIESTLENRLGKFTNLSLDDLRVSGPVVTI